MLPLPPGAEHQDDFASLPKIEQVERLKNGLVATARGGHFEGGDHAYRTVKKELRNDLTVYSMLPPFIRTCSNTGEFWGYIKSKFPTYREREDYLRDEFAVVIEYLEANDRSPGVVPVTEMLEQFNADAVQAIWQKALNRRHTDPEGAITAARTLIETVCKHILDDAGITYDSNEDLPKLWHLTAERLNLAPSQHQEVAFKTILGNCQSIVNQLATIRNSVGDAHGTGRRPVKPKPRHAELVVNLAGSMASFVVATAQSQSTSNPDSPTA